MNSARYPKLRSAAAAAAIAAALVLTGCNRSEPTGSQAALSVPDLPATLPLVPGGPTQLSYAPPVEALPSAPAIQAVRVADPGEYYAYADNASGFEEALDYAPPDYGFEYDDVEPWAWQGYDDSVAFAEPIEDGYRYYYYRAGEDDPYFVRDPYYSYGYDDGRLAAVYDSYGAIVPYEYYGPRIVYASRYYGRGRDLYRASHRHRRAVIAGNWASRQDDIYQSRRRWIAAREQQQDWRAYHERRAPRLERHWQQERVRRRADGVRFAAWRDTGFEAPPPPRAIPADWNRARWARDEQRYAPPARGFDGDAADRRRAAAAERIRIVEQARERGERRRERFASAETAATDRARAVREERLARPERIRAEAEQRRTAIADRRQQQQAAREQRLADLRARTGRPAVEARADAQRQRAERQAERSRTMAARRDAQVERRQQAQQRANARGEQQVRRQAAQQAQQQRLRERREQAQARSEARSGREAAAASQQRIRAQQAEHRQQVEQRRQQQAQQAESRSRAREQAESRSRAREQAQGQNAERSAQRQQAAQAREARQAQQAQRRTELQQRREQVQARVQERQAQRPEPAARMAEARQARRAEAATARSERQQARQQRVERIRDRKGD